MKRFIVVCSIIMVCLYFSGCSNSVEIENEPTGTINISFTIPEKTHVKLWIENAYQTTVWVLVDEERAAGNYTVLVETIDENGNRLPKGVYTYYLETEDKSHSASLVYQ